MKRVVLVGATSGIGRALAHEYLRRGWRVGVVGRERDRVDALLGDLREAVPDGVAEGIVSDVTDEAGTGDAFEEIVKLLGQIDLLVYCAGVMPPERGGEGDGEAMRTLLEVNLLGAVRWLEAGAGYMVAAGGGRLAAIGSVAGDRGRKGAPLYGASKAALHAWLEGLRHRLHGTGVGVSTVKPGWVRTRMLPPGPTRSRASVSPEEAARIVVRGLERGRDAFYVPWWWGLVSVGLRILPRSVYKRIAPP